jgi:hypothetical protein
MNIKSFKRPLIVLTGLALLATVGCSKSEEPSEQELEGVNQEIIGVYHGKNAFPKTYGIISIQNLETQTGPIESTFSRYISQPDKMKMLGKKFDNAKKYFSVEDLLKSEDGQNCISDYGTCVPFETNNQGEITFTYQGESIQLTHNYIPLLGNKSKEKVLINHIN